MTAVRVGAPNDNLGPVRAVDPRRVAAIKRYAEQGVSAPALARMFDVNVRTIYRYLSDGREAVTVRVGAWEAEFSTGGDQVPQRLSEWRRPLDRAEEDALTRAALRQEDEREVDDGR